MRPKDYRFKMIEYNLTLKAQITAAADDILIFIIILFIFSEKITVGISCKSSARQTINMKCKVLFALKNDKVNFENVISLLGALRV